MSMYYEERFGGMKKDSKKGSTLLSRPNSGVLPYIKKPDD